MLRDEAVAQVQEGLGFRTDLDDTIVQRMKRVQRFLEMGRTLPWFLRTLADLPNDVNANMDFPEGFIRETRDPSDFGVQRIEDPQSSLSGFSKIRKMDEYEALLAYGSGDGGDFPQAYFLSTTQFVLIPRNHLASTIRVEYFKKEPVLDTNIENAWLREAPDLIIGNAGASIARTIQNQTAYDEFSQLATTALQAVFNETIEKKVAGRQYILGRNS